MNGGGFTVALTADNSNTASFAVANYVGNVTLNANGNDNVATSIVLNNGDFSLTDGVVTESGGTAGTITLENNDGVNNYQYGSLNLQGNAGHNRFSVNSWSGSGAVTLDGQGGNDTYIINFQAGGSFTTNVADSGSGGNTLTVNGTTGGGTLDVSGGSVSLGSQTVNYSGVENLTLYTKTNSDTVDITGISAATILHTGAGTNTINLGSDAFSSNTGGTLGNMAAALTVSGSGADTLNLDDSGDSTATTAVLTNTTFALSGAFGGGALNYSGIQNLNVNLGSGGNTLLVEGGRGTTQINTGSGSDTVNLRAMYGTMTVNTGGGTNTINLGSLAPQETKGIVNNLHGSLTVVGSGGDTLNVDDSGSAALGSGTLTATTLTGLGMGGLTYSGLAALNIALGSGNQTFNVQSTVSQMVTTVSTGTGTNTIDLGSLAPGVGGILDNLHGPLTVVGGGSSTTVNVDDQGSTGAESGTLTATTLTGLAFGNGGFTYSGLGALNIALGSGTETFNIQSTISQTVSTVSMGTGTDTINLGSAAPGTNGIVDNLQGSLRLAGGGSGTTLNVDDSGSAGAKSGALTATGLTGLGMGAGGLTYSGLAALDLSLGNGGDTFTINSTNASTVTTVKTQGKPDTIDVGSLAAGVNGILNGIRGPLTIAGDDGDTLNVDDSGHTGAGSGTLTAATLTGLGMGAGGITYSGLAALNLSLGGGGTMFTISDTGAQTVTALNSPFGEDTINLVGDGGTTTINAPGGSDTVNIQSTDAATTVNTATSGTNTVNIGSLAPGVGGIADNIRGALTVAGSGGGTTVNVDDTGSAGAKSGTLTATELTDLVGNGGVTYSGVGVLNIALGSGNDTFDVESTASGTVTTISLGTGTNEVVVRTPEPGDTGIVDNIQGTLRVAGGGAGTTLDVDDGWSAGAKSGVLTAMTLTGLGMGAGGITYSGLGALKLSLGKGGNTFTINSTSAATATTVNMGQGSDTITVAGDNGPTNIDASYEDANDTINIRATGGLTTVNTSGGGASTINVGSLAPGGKGVVSTLQGALVVVSGESASDTLNVDDSGDTAARSGTMTSATLTGLGMGAGGITYDSYYQLVALNIALGRARRLLTSKARFSGRSQPLAPERARTRSTWGVWRRGWAALRTTSRGPLAVVGNGVDTTVNVDDTGSAGGKTGMLTATELTDLVGNGGVSYSGVGALNIALGSGNDTFDVESTASGTVTTVSTGTGTDEVVVRTPEPGDTGIVDNIQGTLRVAGGGAGTTLDVDDGWSAGAKSGVLTATTLTGLGMGAGGITYSGLGALKLSLGKGGNTFTISGTSAATATTVNMGQGSDTVTVAGDNGPTNIDAPYEDANDTINIRATGGLTTLNTSGGGASTINVGSLEPGGKGVVSTLQGALVVVSGESASDTLNVDDSGDTAARSGTMTSATLTGLGLGAGGITNRDYYLLVALNIALGSGTETFNVQGTIFGTLTTVSAGTGADTINLGSLAPGVGGIADNIEGPLAVVGNGVDTTVNVDDTGSAGGKTGMLTATELTDLVGNGGVSYSGVGALNIALGSGNDTFDVESTASGTVTTVSTGTGTDEVVVRTPEPGDPGIVDNIQGPLRVAGGGAGTTLDVDDGWSAGAKSGVLTATTLTGLGMGAGGITYSGLGALKLSLGKGGNTFTISGTSAATATTVNMGQGSDTVTVAGDNGPTNIDAPYEDANDTINIRATGGLTTLNTSEGGSSTINVESLEPGGKGIVANLQGTLAVVTGESASDTLNVDDSGDTAARSGTLTAATLTGLGMGAGGITYDSYYLLTAFNIALGSGKDAFWITGTSAGVTRIRGGINGNDTFNVQATRGPLYLIGGAAGGNVFNLGGLAPAAGGSLGGLYGQVFIAGGTSHLRLITLASGGVNTVNLDDSGNASENQGTLTSSAVTGLGMSDGVIFASVNVLNISSSSGDDTIYIQSMDSRTVTTISGGIGANNANLSFTGDFAGNLTLVNFAAGTLSVGGNFDGQLHDTGAITTVTITGSVAITGVLEAGSISTMTVGGNLAGLVRASGLLDSLTVSAGVSGQIIAGDVHTVTLTGAGTLSGMIASQSDVGNIQRDSNGNAVTNASNALIRSGGIFIGGADSGQIIALGNIFGDVTVGGSLTGRIADKGQTVAGLAVSRLGILGNISVNTFASGSAIVSGGLIGDATGGTTVSLGSAQGFVAAAGGVNLAASTTLAAANLLQNLGGSNLAAVSAIFTNGGVPLLFDTGGNLAGLVLMETDLGNIRDNNGALSGTIP